MENIINLNSCFTESINFKIYDFVKIKDYEVYTFSMRDPSKKLLELDQYGLYTKPLNKLSRGGDRFIFTSNSLSSYITKSINKFIKGKHVLIDKNFRFVNHVFRYNKFKPSDMKFISHYDTPYHDPVNKHYSKYTLLLYLTQESGSPAIVFDNGNLSLACPD